MAATRVDERWAQIELMAEAQSDDESEVSYHIGVRDGFAEAVQLIDMLTGGDGEYRFSTDSSRNCSDPFEMVGRMLARVHAS